MKKSIFFGLLFLVGVSIFSVEPLRFFNQDWFFQLDSQTPIQVNLPHSWNAQDSLAGEAIEYYRGKGIYEKQFFYQSKKGMRYFLSFEGANQTSTVFLNEKFVGEHKGGYSAFSFEISPYMMEGENRVKVIVDNSYDKNIIPHVGDFNMYGGIYRPVRFLEKEGEHFILSFWGTNGILANAILNDGDLSGNVNLEIRIDSDEPFLQEVADRFSVLAQLIDKDGESVASTILPVSLVEGKNYFLSTGKLFLANPHLWKGVEDPYLYTVEFLLLDIDKKVDESSLIVGFRDIKIDSQKGFFLNGQPYKIKGVCRHQDFEGLGNALTSQEHRQDFELMKEMGVNAVRLSHYPHVKEVHELADEYGILVWAEIPFVGGGGYARSGYFESPEFYENTKNQLREMIYQNYSHPSIFTWGLFNELKKEGEGPLKLIEELNTLAHRLDPSRYTSCATNADLDFIHVTDLMAWNKYFGWYGSSPAALGGWLDTFHKNYPKVSLGISEYGAGGSAFHHSERTRAPVPNSYFHPENYQTYFHEEHWRIIAERDYLWGTFVWNMFDFGACHRTEGDRPNVNDKGLVSFDRKIKKDAFYFYKANWSDNPVLHINQAKMRKREKRRISIRLYSNLGMPTLTLNSSSIPLKTIGQNTYKSIRSVRLNKGENYVIAEVMTPDGILFRDNVIWEY